ncbi:SLBB domain-containing protein [Daejeonella sp.]|uniref:SLBB domain-containing protein n=1 Tax=Daejeonella sp. TaxID=2805397 RepID=UPI0030BCB733
MIENTGMNFKYTVILLFTFVGILLFHPHTYAQTTGQDLSNVRVDELSDDQVRSFIRQVQATGLGDAQLEQVAQARGMRAEEIQKLRKRVEALKEQDKNRAANQDPNAPRKSARELNYGQDTIPKDVDPATEADKALLELRSKIFGADLFRNSNLTFEPNLNMATPKNYIIGPNDQMLIDIYGNSEASYNLNVSPEGTINVEYVGVIPVGGLTIEAATARLRTRMATVYSGLRNGSTSLNVAIGNIRSIKVILTGEVQKPGTYTLPSLANAFNALYSSGGPTERGSFRAIELIRGGRIIAVLDIYDFLMKGEMTNNLRLQDQDIIRVPVYKSRIEIVGEVKRPGIFELLNNESFVDLLKFSGGFTENAYQARVKVLKNTETERKIADITSNLYNSYIPQTGDKYFVDKVLDRFVNRVSINGAVFRPGQYELQPGLSLSQLISKAEGLKEDAFMQRGYITRLQADGQVQLIPFNVADIVNKKVQDVPLTREDVIHISSIFDLREEYKVAIGGEVRSPGSYPFAEKMTLEALILIAGGFNESSSPKRIEVSRRVKNSNQSTGAAQTAQVFQVDIARDLDFSTPQFLLEPFDIVNIRSSVGYEIQREVKIEGEVLYPGSYTIASKDEKLSDLVTRAGGLTVFAFAKGAALKRAGAPRAGKNSINQTDEEELRLMKLQRLQETGQVATDTIQQLEILKLKNDYVGINLEKVLEEPGSLYDLRLEEGDVLRVPKLLQTVKVSGEILYPVSTIFNSGRSFKYYISQGGGFSNKSLKRRSYVIYANGSVKSTRKILFFNDYPSIEQGAELFVPKKEDSNQKLTAQELLGITTGIASLGAIILGILNLTSGP